MNRFIQQLLNSAAVFNAEGTGTTDGGGAPDGGAGAGGGHPSGGAADGGAGSTPAENAAGTGDDPFAGITDASVKDWLTRSKIESPEALAKKALEQERHLGDTIRVPGDDATDEERNKFYERIGRPADKDGYEFKVPENMPETLPYDEGAANDFKGKAHELGLTAKQAATLHDWFVEQQVATVAQAGEAAGEGLKKIALDTREELVKMWGPLDGQTAKANAEFADKALSAAGDPQLVADLQTAGLLDGNKQPLNARFASLMATLGAALYKEDDVLKGSPAAIGNPFDRGSPHFNMTAGMELYKKNPDHAKTLMRAAGTDPKSLGIPD